MNEYISVKKFAESAPELYGAMRIYADHCQAENGIVGKMKFTDVTKDTMAKAINKEYFAEIVKRSGITVEAYDGSLQRFAQNPNVQHFADAIRNYMIDMILPETLMNSALRYIADFRFEGLGDSMSFDIKNNSLMTVSKAGYRKRNTSMQKLYDTTVTLVPENHMITTGTDLFEILTDRVSIADETMKAVRSIETYMLFNAYDAFTVAMTGVAGTSLSVANYSVDSLIKLCQTVTAYNQGRKAVILGTEVALQSVLPEGNYRYLLESDFVTQGYLTTFKGYDVVPLSQVADPYNSTPYSLKLDDTKIYVVSPGSDKLIKIGVGGDTMSHTDAIYDNANLLQMTTIGKAWDCQCITNSTAGVITNLG